MTKMTDPISPPESASSGETVEFLFDYASPWAFLANALLPRRLPGVRIFYRPVYLAGFDSFAKGLPYSPAKLNYLLRDFQRCALYEGVRPFFPPTFPINGLYALRGAIAAQRLGCFDDYHAVLFDAAWAQGRDIASKAAVAALAREVGLGAVAEALDDPSLKQALRDNTTHAAERGVFGVPSFFVGDELFWGYDRLDQVARQLQK
jgi:2-hydroxychromene-2-carboxylate isomerase